MPGKGRIKIDEHFIREVKGELEKLRNQISLVRDGVNPNDPNHPTGPPWIDLKVLAGSDNFDEGQRLKARLAGSSGSGGSIGGQVDGKLDKLDKTLSTYSQGLGNILISSDNIERANGSAASLMSFLTGTPPTPKP